MPPFITSLAFKIGAPIVALAMLAGAFVWHGNSRYKDGVEATDAAYLEASENLKRKSVASASAANESQAAADAAHAGQVLIEKEKIDEAQANGDSVFDVMFDSM